MRQWGERVLARQKFALTNKPMIHVRDRASLVLLSIALAVLCCCVVVSFDEIVVVVVVVVVVVLFGEIDR